MMRMASISGSLSELLDLVLQYLKNNQHVKLIINVLTHFCKKFNKYSYLTSLVTVRHVIDININLVEV